MKLVISDTKTGKSFQVEVEKAKEGQLIGKKIGEEIDGGIVGAAGYALVITGGSDTSGFPMRADVAGPGKKLALLSDAPGFRRTKKGERAKKRVRGNVISDEIAQVNVKVSTPGSKPLEEIFSSAEKAQGAAGRPGEKK